MKNFIYLFSIVLFSCSSNVQKTEPSSILSDTTKNAVTPLLGKNHEGHPYLWWIEKSEDDKNVVMFSVSTDKGANFGKPARISITEGCNDGHGQGMPRLIFKKDGSILIVYHVKEGTEENPFAGKVLYSQSYDQGKTWKTPRLLHQDTSRNNSHGFPALTLLPDGEVGAIWLDGRNKLPYSELFLSKTEGKKGFVSETKVGGPSCQCCKLEFYTDANQQVHILYRGIMEDNIRDIMHIASSDSGKTFSVPQRISEDGWKLKGCPHAGPAMTLHNDSLRYVWFTMGGGEGVFYCRSDKNGAEFSGRENLAKGISKYPQIVSSGKKLAIAWQSFDSVSVKDKSYNRIVLQWRDQHNVQNAFISEEGQTAIHPSLLALDNGELMLAYELEKNGKTRIVYRIVKE